MKRIYKVKRDVSEYSERELERSAGKVLGSYELLNDLNFDEVLGSYESAQEACAVAASIDVKPYYHGNSSFINIPIVLVASYDIDESGNEIKYSGEDINYYCCKVADVEELIAKRHRMDEEDED